MSVHPYRRSPFSGAGNCECGWWERSPIHGYSRARRPARDGLKAIADAVRKARGGDAPTQIRGYA